MHGVWRLPLAQVAAGEALHEYDTTDDVAGGTQRGHSPETVAQHVIYLYNKTKDDMAPGFRFETG